MNRIFSIIVMLAVGWVLRRLNLLKPENSSILNKVVIVVAFPALIIISLNQATITLSLFRIVVPAILTPAIICAIAYAFGSFLRLPPKALGAFVLVSSFGNTGFLGIPLTIKLLGINYLPNAIIYDAIGTGVMVWVLGLSIAIYLGRKTKGGKLPLYLILPPFIGLAIGFALNGVHLPTLAEEVLRDLSALIVPLIMISIGITLGARKVSGAILIISIAALFKLFLSPLTAHFIGSAVSLGAVSSKAVLLQSSMPTALATSIIGAEYDLTTEILSGTILISTVLTMVTTPMLLRLWG